MEIGSYPATLNSFLADTEEMNVVRVDTLLFEGRGRRARHRNNAGVRDEHNHVIPVALGRN